MTNYEKYKDELIKYLLCGGFAVRKDSETIVACVSNDITCDDCRFREPMKGCNAVRLEWLDEEYKEPEHHCEDCEYWARAEDMWGVCFGDISGERKARRENGFCEVWELKGSEEK